MFKRCMLVSISVGEKFVAVARPKEMMRRRLLYYTINITYILYLTGAALRHETDPLLVHIARAISQQRQHPNLSLDIHIHLS